MDKKARDRTCQFVREQYPEREPGSWMTQILDLCAALDAAEEQARALESRAVAAEFRLHFGGQDPTYAVRIIPGLDATGAAEPTDRREAAAPTLERGESASPWLPYSHRTQGSGFFLRLRPDFAFDVRYGPRGFADKPLSADYVASEFMREWGKSAEPQETARSEPVTCAIGDACCELASGFRDELLRVLGEVGTANCHVGPIDLRTGIAPRVKKRIGDLSEELRAVRSDLAEACFSRDQLSAQVAARKTWVPGAGIQWTEPPHTGERLCCKERDDLRAELVRVADELGFPNVDLKSELAPRAKEMRRRFDETSRRLDKECANHSATKRLIRDLADAARRMGIT